MTAPSPRFGLGSTLVFQTSLVEIEITKIDWDELTRTIHNATHLGTPKVAAGKLTNAKKVPGPIVESGPIKFSGHYAGAVLNLIKAAPETVVLTMPLLDGEATAEKFTFTGFVSGVKPGNLDPDAFVINDVTLVIADALDYDPATLA